jgi:hypothetical protein
MSVGGGARGAGAPRAGGAGAVGFGTPPAAGAAPRAGGAGPGAAAPRGAGAGAGGGAAAQPPVVLSRNGKDFRITGSQHTVRAGTEIKVKTERPAVSVSLSEMDKGSWVVFELPGFTTAASGKQQDSIDALRKSNETSYFKDKDSLWVKLVVPVDPGGPLANQVSLAASR